MKGTREFIYVSHPFSANPEKNREMARATTRLLTHRCGINIFVFINPLDLFMGQSLASRNWGNGGDDWILSQAIEVMLKCDGVIFCDGWKKSKGCRMEHYAAWKAGLPRWLGAEAFIANWDQQEELFEQFDMLVLEELIAKGEMRRGHPEDLQRRQAI